MNHRSAVAAVLTAALLAAGLAPPTAALADPQGPQDHGLAQLRADAHGPVQVHRDRFGARTALGSTDGEALVSAPAGAHGPRAAAAGYVRRYGPAFHIDGGVSSTRTMSTIPTVTGGHVVRVDQAVDGIPVFGGQLVMTLDGQDGLVSVAGATTDATSPGTVTVDVATARRTAVAVAAKTHRVPARTLHAVDLGRWLYDPALVGSTDPGGTRAVWRFEVSDGKAVREVVLVDAQRGRVALHFDENNDLTRVVCDDENAAQTQVPGCSTATARRGETTGPVGDTDVDAAFANVGEAADFYRQVAGLDLGELLGTGAAGSRRLQSWVRWCYTGQECPMHNASWDGTHMVFGEGYAAADDVVAHELTHGVIDHTSQLFYLHQSGAINESLADVIGELVDQRNHRDGEDDSGWLLGEDVPGGPIRSMKDPTLFGQPDSMTSPLWSGDDAFADEGAVHQNSGVGNKAAYLISQGGTFHGVTVRGIDAGDPMLTKTAVLYTEVIKRLPSGAQYADLAHTLEGTCAELAAAGTDGFSPADCDSVAAAVRATAMTRPPTDPAAGPGQAPDTCPTGTVKRVLFHDDDGTSHPWQVGKLWMHAPNTARGVPGYASSGRQSWFAYEPDPAAWQDPPSSSLRSLTPVRIPRHQRTYLRFHHAYLLEWYDATATAPARYPDGASVDLFTATGTGWRRETTPLRWVNGPDKLITSGGAGSPWTGFGGDSHGYNTSRLDLTPLAGHRIEPQWTVAGDRSGSFLGWYVDDVEVYTCAHVGPSAPRRVTVRGTTHGAVVSWRPPADPGSGVAGYRVRRSDGLVRTVGSAARSLRLHGLPSGRRVVYSVAALDTRGRTGPAVRRVVRRTRLAARTSTTRVRPAQRFRLAGRLARVGSGTAVAGRTVVFQRRAPRGRWRTLARRTTRRDGTVALRVVGHGTALYRLVYPGAAGWAGSRTPALRVRVS